MAVNSPASNQSFGRTFIVAAVIIGLVALTQLGAVAWAFFTKAKPDAVAKGEDELPKAPPARIDVQNLPGTQDATEALAVTEDPINEPRGFPSRPSPIKIEQPSQETPMAVPAASDAANEVAVSPTPVVPPPPSPPAAPLAVPLIQPRPTPVPLSAFTPKQNPRFTELVEQGKLLRNTGDTAGALNKFREAALIEPANPLPIAEAAYTYEKMSLPDKAAEQWRILLAMGEGAGVYFSAAQAKLNAAIKEAKGMVQSSSSQAAPFPPGKVLQLSQPRIQDDRDPMSQKKFTLQVPIRAKGGETISVRDMKVVVLFYEKLASGDIVRTTANVSNRWQSPPIDWAEGEEGLEVAYDLPRNEASGEPREYYGYIVRLYYSGDLQDTQAQPAGLAQKFPADSQTSE